MLGGQTDKAMRQVQLGSSFQALASADGGPLTFVSISPLLTRMLRKKSPRLAAAFVVTISAGCGGATPPPENGTNETSTTDTDGMKKPEDPKKPNGPTGDGPENPDWVPNIGSVKGGFEKDGDGKCFIVHPANPPWREPVDCATQEPLKKKDQETPKPADPSDANLKDAPTGWTVQKDPSGGCRAFAPDKCQPNTRCNPPPPQNVKCPPNMP